MPQGSARSAFQFTAAIPTMPPMDQPAPLPAAKRCPICGKPTLERFRPFCSKRCADVDLNRWLSGSYAVPAVEEDEGEASEQEDDARS
jgi:uncharacterized protein